MNVFVCSYDLRIDGDKDRVKVFAKREQCFRFLKETLENKLKVIKDPSEITKYKVIIKLIESSELDLVYDALNLITVFKMEIKEVKLEGHVMS
jgi:hypothetical protein